MSSRRFCGLSLEEATSDVRGQPVLPHWQSVRNVAIGRVRTAVERTSSELKRAAHAAITEPYRDISQSLALAGEGLRA